MPVTMPSPDCLFDVGLVGVQVIKETRDRATRSLEAHDASILKKRAR